MLQKCLFVLVVLFLFGAPFATCAPQNWVVQTGYGVNSTIIGFAQAWATLSFFPQNLTVNVGDTVTWVLTDDAHTVTFNPTVLPVYSDPTNLIINPTIFPIMPDGGNGTLAAPAILSRSNGTYSSGIMEIPGQNWTATFPNTGTFFYFCLVHLNMQGYITVNPANTTYPQTQAQIAAAVIAEQQLYQQEVVQLDAKVKTLPTGNLLSDGSANITIDNGYGDVNLHFSLNTFGPDFFQANVGDTINFVLGDTAVGHTISMNGSNDFNWQLFIPTANGSLTVDPLYFRAYGNPGKWYGQFVSGGIQLPAGYNFGAANAFTVVIDSSITQYYTLPHNFTFLCNLHSIIVPTGPSSQTYVGMVGQFQLNAQGTPRPANYNFGGSPPSSGAGTVVASLIFLVLATMLLVFA